MTGCGIDFGTSNSAICLGGLSHARLVAVEGEDVTLPSALFYPASGKPPAFGRAAVRLFSEGEDGRFMRSLKRLLGTEAMSWSAIVNDKPRRYEDIIAGFVRHLKTRAENAAGTALDSVVMGRPVHFVDYDHDADRAAETQLRAVARLAGFSHVEFQYEPIAAAFAHERALTCEKLALVVDIGGGTSDFTVIRLSPAGKNRKDRANDILGGAGVRTGGNDFDKALSLSAFMPQFGYGALLGGKGLSLPLGWFHDLSEWSKINFLYTPKFRGEIGAMLKEPATPGIFRRFVKAVGAEKGHAVLSAIERCKIALTEAQEASADLGFIEDGFAVTAARRDLEDAIAAELEKITQAISACLAAACLAPEAVELVVLTGGPTETPAVKALVQGIFPNAALSEDDKLSSVAQGLGYDSTRVFGP